MECRKTELISMLRSQCSSKGYGGFKGLGLIFRRMDSDYSKRITFPELYHGIRAYGLNITNTDFKILFDALDKDGSGEIDFREFMLELRGPVADCRKSVIREAFDKIDVNKDGVISVEDLKVIYADKAKEHPCFRSGEWTLDQTLRYFLDALDTPGCPDGKVTWEEFLMFYSGVSATVDDDCYFDLLMRACYDLPMSTSWSHEFTLGCQHFDQK